MIPMNRDNLKKTILLVVLLGVSTPSHAWWGQETLTGLWDSAKSAVTSVTSYVQEVFAKPAENKGIIAAGAAVFAAAITGGGIFYWWNNRDSNNNDGQGTGDDDSSSDSDDLNSAPSSSSSSSSSSTNSFSSSLDDSNNQNLINLANDDQQSTNNIDDFQGSLPDYLSKYRRDLILTYDSLHNSFREKMVKLWNSGKKRKAINEFANYPDKGDSCWYNYPISDYKGNLSSFLESHCATCNEVYKKMCSDLQSKIDQKWVVGKRSAVITLLKEWDDRMPQVSDSSSSSSTDSSSSDSDDLNNAPSSSSNDSSLSAAQKIGKDDTDEDKEKLKQPKAQQNCKKLHDKSVNDSGGAYNLLQIKPEQVDGLVSLQNKNSLHRQDSDAVKSPKKAAKSQLEIFNELIKTLSKQETDFINNDKAMKGYLDIRRKALEKKVCDYTGKNAFDAFKKILENKQNKSVQNNTSSSSSSSSSFSSDQANRKDVEEDRKQHWPKLAKERGFYGAYYEGYVRFASDDYCSGQYNSDYRIGKHLNSDGSPDQGYLNKTVQNYKIHLMPKQRTKCLIELFELIKSNKSLQEAILSFKILPRQDIVQSGKSLPIIVIYVGGKQQAQNALNEIYKHFTTNAKHIEGLGITPRYNKKYNELIFAAGGDGDYKKDHLKGYYQDQKKRSWYKFDITGKMCDYALMHPDQTVREQEFEALAKNGSLDLENNKIAKIWLIKVANERCSPEFAWAQLEKMKKPIPAKAINSNSSCSSSSSSSSSSFSNAPTGAQNLLQANSKKWNQLSNLLKAGLSNHPLYCASILKEEELGPLKFGDQEILFDKPNDIAKLLKILEEQQKASDPSVSLCTELGFVKVQPFADKISQYTPPKAKKGAIHCFLIHGTQKNGKNKENGKQHGKDLSYQSSVSGNMNARVIAYANGKKVIVYSGEWIGELSRTARQSSAKEACKQFKEVVASGDDEIWIIAHSHGGNVAAMAANQYFEETGKDIDVLITLGTPDLDVKQEINAKKTFHFYSQADCTQLAGSLESKKTTERKMPYPQHSDRMVYNLRTTVITGNEAQFYRGASHVNFKWEVQQALPQIIATVETFYSKYHELEVAIDNNRKRLPMIAIRHKDKVKDALSNTEKSIAALMNRKVREVFCAEFGNNISTKTTNRFQDLMNEIGDVQNPKKANNNIISLGALVAKNRDSHHKITIIDSYPSPENRGPLLKQSKRARALQISESKIKNEKKPMPVMYANNNHK